MLVLLHSNSFSFDYLRDDLGGDLVARCWDGVGHIAQCSGVVLSRNLGGDSFSWSNFKILNVFYQWEE